MDLDIYLVRHWRMTASWSIVVFGIQSLNYETRVNLYIEINSELKSYYLLFLLCIGNCTKNWLCNYVVVHISKIYLREVLWTNAFNLSYYCMYLLSESIRLFIPEQKTLRENRNILENLFRVICKSSIQPKTMTVTKDIMKNGDGETYATKGVRMKIHYIAYLKEGKKNLTAAVTAESHSSSLSVMMIV